MLAARERRRVYLLVPAITLMALMQVVGIASIMPFLALVANPDAVHQNGPLSWAYSTLGMTSETRFLILLGLGAFSVLVLSNSFAAFTDWLLYRFSWSLNHTLSVRMLEEYMSKRYSFFLDQNTSNLGKNLLSEVKQVVKGFVVSGMNLLARGAVALFTIALLVVVNPLLALAALVVLGGAYTVIYFVVRSRLSRTGRQRSIHDRERYRAATEALSGIKEIKLLGKEQEFIRQYAKPSAKYANLMAKQQVIGHIPRYGLEAVAFGGLILIVVYLLATGSDLQSMLPLLGVYGFASYRLMPALQTVFTNLTSLRFSASAVELLYNDVDKMQPKAPWRKEAGDPLPFRDTLELRDIRFAYPNSAPVLQGFNLQIRARTSTALVGATGSGKTTTVDLILGLLQPQQGGLFVDGVEVTEENVRRWQKNIGYVPQLIYLKDDTVARNIALGVPSEEIDMEAVVRAARLANIHDFISEEMPKGYSSIVGERGVRLSGGQRQRLGIARALYHNPEVLVLDEATSALDGVTEESVFRAVSEIGKTKTVVMIAHRLSTVRDCDTIVVLERGRITAQGSYDELLETSPQFQALARQAGYDRREVAT